MNRNQFELALNQAKPSDWLHFEQLCSKFLASEHPTMRTMASPSGDGGRDSELLTPDGEKTICAQYSVASDWSAKINKTYTRLKENFPEIKILIFLSNQEIGANGDKIKRTFLLNGVFLDIRDKNWFLERFDSNDQRRDGAGAFFEQIGRPYLENLDVIGTKKTSLSNQESKAALVYLGMQWEDSTTDKGLTKLSFEALVRAALRKTDADHRMSRIEIYAAINKYLPSHTIDSIKIQVDSAIKRLERSAIKHLTTCDEFHLAYEEQQRLTDKLSTRSLEDTALDAEIHSNLKKFSASLDDSVIDQLGKITKQVLDLSLLKTGENFAASVLTGSIQKIDMETVKSIIFTELANSHQLPKEHMEKYPTVIISTLEHLIKSQNESVRKHLKCISDTYTLFAFLRETTDVQKATKKIFSYGKIWLDTTLILPLFADYLLTEQREKKFSLIMKELIACKVDVFIGTGVVNEVLNHIRISLQCSQMGSEWKGRVPYLYGKYIESGRDRSQYRNWLTQFRGDERPEQDILDFLKSEHKIKLADLTEDFNRADEKLRFAVDRLWRDAHHNRRNGNSAGIESDTVAIDILIKNDVVNYIGIIERRKKETNSDLGYQHWWLTIDSTAWGIRNSLSIELEEIPSSPLMSLDFLVQNISFGPNRNFITRSDEQLLPILLDLDIFEAIPADVLRVAEEVRLQSVGQPEYVIQRNVRDACDRARKSGIGMAKNVEDILQ